MTNSASEPGKAGQSALIALREFADPTIALDRRRTLLTMLIRDKVLPKHADMQEAKLGRDYLLKAAQESVDPAGRLMAVADCVRMSQVVKRWSDELKSGLVVALQSPLPPIQHLSEVDDRLNIARACSVAPGEWIASYLELAIATEETGERARMEATSVLLHRSTSLDAMLRRLASAFVGVSIATEAPGTSIARRQARTLACVRSVLSTYEGDIGETVGDATHAFVVLPRKKHGKSADEKATRELVTEILAFIHELVRFRISFAIDSKTYQSVKDGRDLLGGGAWPNSLKTPLARLIQSVSEGLLLLARQGVADEDLRRQLDVLCNFPERATSIAAELADRHPEIPEPVRHWLKTGRLRTQGQTNAVAFEASLRSADESLGIALQSAAHLRLLLDQFAEAMRTNSTAGGDAPRRIHEELIDQARALLVNVERLGVIRELMLYGTVGEPVPMSPKLFISIGDTPTSRPSVLVPAVVRRRPDGTPGEVVTRGTVK